MISAELHVYGFAVIDFEDADFERRVNSVQASLFPRLGADLNDSESDKRTGDRRIQDAWKFNEDVNLLSRLYVRRAFPFTKAQFSGRHATGGVRRRCSFFKLAGAIGVWCLGCNGRCICRGGGAILCAGIASSADRQQRHDRTPRLGPLTGISAGSVLGRVEHDYRSRRHTPLKPSWCVRTGSDLVRKPGSRRRAANRPPPPDPSVAGHTLLFGILHILRRSLLGRSSWSAATARHRWDRRRQATPNSYFGLALPVQRKCLRVG